jgi:hypothetical protein
VNTKNKNKITYQPNQKLETNLRNAAATFGTESAQYKSVLSMVQSYISGPKVLDFAPSASPVHSKTATREDAVKETPAALKVDASTAPETAHTFTLSNLAYRPKPS